MTDNNPYGPDVEPGRRRRAGLTLGGFALIAVVALVALVVWLLGRGLAPDQTVPAAPPPPDALLTQPAAPDTGGWDIATETALATRAMLSFPEQLTQPHVLTTDTAGPPLQLPRSGQSAGRLVAGGFPATAEGALGQLAALTETGLAGGDPQVYAQAYQSVALPGAPAAESTALYTGLQQLRARAGIATTGGVNGLEIFYTTTDGLIKGTADGGRYAVACVLGELTVQVQGRSVSGGIGDCQALRYSDGDWRISPGAAAFKAPSAWPGTAEAVRAGYRAVG